MATARQVLESKGDGVVWSIGPDNSVFDAIQMMSEKEIGALMVMEGNRPVGIVSERDYARKVILKGRSSRETPIREIMTRRVISVPSDTPVGDCMALMKEKKIRHLPVMDTDKLVGMLSMRDILNTIIADQQYTIEQLERYIAG